MLRKTLITPDQFQVRESWAFHRGPTKAIKQVVQTRMIHPCRSILNTRQYLHFQKRLTAYTTPCSIVAWRWRLCAEFFAVASTTLTEKSLRLRSVSLFKGKWNGWTWCKSHSYHSAIHFLFWMIVTVGYHSFYVSRWAPTRLNQDLSSKGGRLWHGRFDLGPSIIKVHEGPRELVPYCSSGVRGLYLLDIIRQTFLAPDAPRTDFEPWMVFQIRSIPIERCPATLQNGATSLFSQWTNVFPSVLISQVDFPLYHKSFLPFKSKAAKKLLHWSFEPNYHPSMRLWTIWRWDAVVLITFIISSIGSCSLESTILFFSFLWFTAPCLEWYCSLILDWLDLEIDPLRNLWILSSLTASVAWNRNCLPWCGLTTRQLGLFTHTISRSFSLDSPIIPRSWLF